MTLPSAGSLEVLPALLHPELLAEPVAQALSHLAADIGVASIDPALSDTAAFCDYYKIPLERAANCIILEAKRADTRILAACIVCGSDRADVNGVVRRALEARSVSFAPRDTAVAESKMEFGAITPIGLPSEWPILVDERAAGAEWVIIGSGIRGSKLIVPGAMLRELPGAQVLDLVKKS